MTYDLSPLQCEGLDLNGQPSLSVQTIVSVSKLISPAVLRQALHFLYTGRLEDNANCNVRVSLSHVLHSAPPATLSLNDQSLVNLEL